MNRLAPVCDLTSCCPCQRESSQSIQSNPVKDSYSRANSYTDGITEIRDEEGEMFDRARLVQAIQTVQHEPTFLIRDNVLTAVRQFMAAQLDDLTLMVIRPGAVEAP